MSLNFLGYGRCFIQHLLRFPSHCRWCQPLRQTAAGSHRKKGDILMVTRTMRTRAGESLSRRAVLSGPQMTIRHQAIRRNGSPIGESPA